MVKIPAQAMLIMLLVSYILPLHAADEEDKIVRVVEMASKAIVNIKTEEWSKTPEENRKPSIFQRFLGEENEAEAFENQGSGVVLDPKGIIVTNEHLISKAFNIRVKFMNGKEYEAYVLGSDPEFDIALLKVTDKVDFPCLKVTKPHNIRVGQKAIVIGNPFGLSSSISAGVVSALDRNLKIDGRVYANLIQTDAAINPGNSGGALLDMEGNPLGIVTAIYGEGKGIGFAIPMDDVMRMLSEFLESGIKRPIFGVFTEKRRDERGSYFYVAKVIPGSPADKYGVKPGDRVIELNRKKIKEGMKPHSVLRSMKVGRVVQFKIVRNSKPLFLNIDDSYVEGYLPLPVDQSLCNMRVADIRGYPKLKFKLKEKEGVVVTKIYSKSAGDRCGLLPGDVILKVNNNAVSGTKDFESFMVEGLKRNYILYQVKRNEEIFFAPVKLDTLL
ncbi:MAG: trypsin-like peptidase domain-containing protein [Syntrophobacterales bacterium]|nr:trypsin-like peptidase domain-containing protein [Syntrophobacterales bacterium]